MLYEMDDRGPQQLVEEFHAVFGHPDRRGEGPAIEPAEALLRLRLMHEEMDEVAAAIGSRDLVATAKELADLVYVAFGTALAFGIDLDAVLHEVHQSNLTKLGPDGRPSYNEQGKVLKGSHYVEPDVEQALFPNREGARVVRSPRSRAVR